MAKINYLINCKVPLHLRIFSTTNSKPMLHKLRFIILHGCRKENDISNKQYVLIILCIEKLK